MSSSELMISQKISYPPSVVDSSHKASCDRTKPNHLCRNKARRSVAHRRGTKRQMDYRVAYKNPCGGPRNGLSFAPGPRVRSPFPPVESEGKPAAVDGAPRRRRRKKAGLIEIELEGGRRVRVDRDVDAAALERVLMKKIRKYLHLVRAARTLARGISQQFRGGKEIRVAGDDLDHRRRCDDPIALVVDERIGADNQPADALPGQAREHLVEFGFAAARSTTN
jgi:transposase